MIFSELILDKSLWNILLRFVINAAVLYIIIGRIYYRFSRKEEFLFFYTITGIMIFLISSILGSIDLQIGLALGLFAIFSIIRFRTVAFSVKDMTYMFCIIGISIINSQANIQPPVIGALVVNLAIILITWYLEKFLQRKSMEKRCITINKLALLKPEARVELLKELSLITGHNIEKVVVERIDFDKNRAELEIYFREERLKYEDMPGSKDISELATSQQEISDDEKVVRTKKTYDTN